MSSIEDFARVAGEGAHLFRTSEPESALVYSVEEVINAELGWAELRGPRLAEFVDAVSEAEGIDSPEIAYVRSSGAVLASADREHHLIAFRGRTTNAGVVLHEIAHLTTGSLTHGVAFRDEYVRLVRRHVGVEHAALLHGIFVAAGLAAAPWESLK